MESRLTSCTRYVHSPIPLYAGQSFLEFPPLHLLHDDKSTLQICFKTGQRASLVVDNGFQD